MRDLAPVQGWDVPSFPTVHRWWTAQAATNRDMLRHGREAMLKARTLPALRDETTIAALDYVSLDGWTLDLWADFGDGRAARPVMIALVDVASNVVLDFGLAPSENAAATVRLITRVCETYGTFDRLHTDNGSAFAGHLVAGGVGRAFRTGGRAADAPTPPGICQHLGIETIHALPGNAQAEIAERVFATVSRSVDDRPELAGAHAGHAPGAAPGTPPIAPAHHVVAGRSGAPVDARREPVAVDPVATAILSKTPKEYLDSLDAHLARLSGGDVRGGR